MHQPIDTPESDTLNARFHYLRGLTWEHRGELDRAQFNYSHAIRVAQSDEEGDAVWYVWSLHSRGMVYHFRGLYADAICDFENVLRRSPQMAWSSNALAWLLATCPEPMYRDGGRAIMLARLACEQSHWQHRQTIDTLAAAFAETGDFVNAVAYQTQAASLASHDDDGGYLRRLLLYQSSAACRSKGPKEFEDESQVDD